MTDHRIVITDPVQLRRMIRFAQRHNCQRELADRLLQLFMTLTMGMTTEENGTVTGEAPGVVVAEVHHDFAPLSLSWAIFRDCAQQPLHRGPEAKCVYNGGFIYDGPGSPADGSFPSLTVSLDRLTGGADLPTHRWGIHT